MAKSHVICRPPQPIHQKGWWDGIQFRIARRPQRVFGRVLPGVEPEQLPKCSSSNSALGPFCPCRAWAIAAGPASIGSCQSSSGFLPRGSCSLASFDLDPFPPTFPLLRYVITPLPLFPPSTTLLSSGGAQSIKLAVTRLHGLGQPLQPAGTANLMFAPLPRVPPATLKSAVAWGESPSPEAGSLSRCPISGWRALTVTLGIGSRAT